MSIVVGDRPAGLLQGLVLTAVSTLAVMGVVLITPILPQMEAHYSQVPGAEALVRIALTIPALCIFLLSPLAGWLADRVSRRRVLLASMLIYAAFGTAPLYLDSLPAIIFSRIGVGVAEAALMTASTTLIGDYFAGTARERWFAAQTGVAAISAVLLFLIGGFLGDIGWRAPFAMYSVSLFLFVALLLFTWEPNHRQERPASAGPFPWHRMGWIYGISTFCAIVFYTVPIQLPFILNARGVTTPSQIGLATAFGSMAVPVGSALFAWWARTRVPLLLTLGLTLAGTGLVGVTYAAEYRYMLLSVIVNQLGCGLLLPTLLTWAVRELPFELRGRGTGIWTASFFVGQFASPLILLGASGVTGGLLPSVFWLGVVCLGGAAVAVVASRLQMERGAIAVGSAPDV